MPHLEPLRPAAKQDRVRGSKPAQPAKSKKLSLPKRDPRSGRRG
jgi:hypothetical protein